MSGPGVRIQTPATPNAAVEASSSLPDARFFAGGTDLMVDIHRNGVRPAGFILLSGIPALRQIAITDSHVQLGSAATMAHLLEDEKTPDLLRQAARTLGTRQVRTNATIGGNVAVPRANHTMLAPLLALGAHVVTLSPEGERTEPIESFLQRSLHEHELLTRVDVPLSPSHATTYLRVGPRNGPCYPTVDFAITIDPSGQRIRAGIGGAAPTALCPFEADAFASGAIDWNADSIPDDVATEYAERVVGLTDPVTDVVATAAYRKHAVTVMARRALQRTWLEVSRGR